VDKRNQCSLITSVVESPYSPSPKKFVAWPKLSHHQLVYPLTEPNYKFSILHAGVPIPTLCCVYTSFFVKKVHKF
jgi:hypothetical protein